MQQDCKGIDNTLKKRPHEGGLYNDLPGYLLLSVRSAHCRFFIKVKDEAET